MQFLMFYAIYNLQEAHTIRKDSPEGRTCGYIYRKQNWFTVCCLKNDELQFINIISVNKVVILCSVDILYYVCQIVLLKLFR
jgi:hypothetical protein